VSPYWTHLSTPEELARRPPIGFVVEGTTEYNSYPSIVCRCVAKGITLRLPIANARGSTRLIGELEELIEDLVATNHPMVIVVTLDERDPIEDGAFDSCADLRSSLQTRCDDWLAHAHSSGRLFPLPDRIVVVIQCPSFEAWLIADITGLARVATVVGNVDTTIQWIDVDSEVENPGIWLGRLVHSHVKLKPLGAATIARRVDPAIIELKSRSFKKFAKEIRAAYELWVRGCGFEPK
jgi:hypothetical protein